MKFLPTPIQLKSRTNNTNLPSFGGFRTTNEINSRINPFGSQRAPQNSTLSSTSDVFTCCDWFYYTLEGVSFCLYLINQPSCTVVGPVIEIKNTDKNQLAFLSVGYDSLSMELVDKQIICNGSYIKFDCDYSKSIQIGIISFDEWLNDQKILTNNSKFEVLIQSKTMKKSSDFGLVVRVGEETEEIRCHSNILCIKSQYFFNMLEESEFSDVGSGSVDTHCSKEALIPILEYIYTGELQKEMFKPENYEIILEMYDKVCEYQIEKLKEMLQIFLLAYLNNLNYRKLLSSNILGSSDEFAKTAVQFIANFKPWDKNSEYLISSPSIE